MITTQKLNFVNYSSYSGNDDLYMTSMELKRKTNNDIDNKLKCNIFNSKLKDNNTKN